MNNFELEALINAELKPDSIKDYSPNGLQVQGRDEIKTIVTGVTACQDLIDAAIEQNADAILVHHGYFWRGEPQQIRGMKYQRIKKLIEYGINLYGYHLPLDIHPTLGNNAQLAKRLGIELLGGLEPDNPVSIPVYGKLSTPMTLAQFEQQVATVLNRAPLVIDGGQQTRIETVGLCTGGAQDFIDLAASQGMDAYLSGEISERTTFSAREQGVHYIAAGHHATERYGVKALGEWIAQQHGLNVHFIDIDNPA
ncbi:Nif3-like dinuclear metal center hexameric protein [Salinivibrio kushneri]|uniref:GTP cyclohydrolase 1 type 2 homolog n=1 Tax=Salinivibrio kushneri TaxID=1908198 RepID=A0AB36JZD4_9GAMM|nr:MULTISPECIES: Nif3-like dinuclear metal center hexameric protein [Salinivibrio]ODP98637.1 Nif3-like dinuclear metal center hexameric protein [Salinivibrio sp. BNH]OOE41139.1 Nif3-like dinuclear metal center hexameric protein [Salinivibrio kushneri]QCP01746.1 Nif3-like dinuclear metal center hexameric protein [Salinivibrio kushneri]